MRPEEVHELLVNIRANRLYHANTVTTSCTFLEHGALLSRGYVENHNLRQTGQFSDSIDKSFGIWNAVFIDHVDIHHRAGRRRGPNHYGPVLFHLDVNNLLQLPSGTDIRITRCNPVHWTRNTKDKDRWFQSADQLVNSFCFGDFDKMLVITTPDGRIQFPSGKLSVTLDNPRRQLSNCVDGYCHAEQRLKAAAKAGGITIEIEQRQCRTDCICETKYHEYPGLVLDSRFM